MSLVSLRTEVWLEKSRMVGEVRGEGSCWTAEGLVATLMSLDFIPR